MRAVAIIPAKGTSRRIPNKNRLIFFGKPILAYSIETALRSKLFDAVYVSTEDDEIGLIARKYGAALIHRPAQLAEIDGYPDCGTQEVTRHAITVLLGLGDTVEFACCVYPCSPLMSARDLSAGFRILEMNPKAAFAYAVGGESAQDAANFYWGRAQAFLDRVPLDPLAENVWKIGIPKERVCDINTIEDFARAEEMFAQAHKHSVPT